MPCRRRHLFFFLGCRFDLPDGGAGGDRRTAAAARFDTPRVLVSVECRTPLAQVFAPDIKGTDGDDYPDDYCLPHNATVVLGDPH